MNLKCDTICGNKVVCSFLSEAFDTGRDNRFKNSQLSSRSIKSNFKRTQN